MLVCISGSTPSWCSGTCCGDLRNAEKAQEDKVKLLSQCWEDHNLLLMISMTKKHAVNFRVTQQRRNSLNQLCKHHWGPVRIQHSSSAGVQKMRQHPNHLRQPRKFSKTFSELHHLVQDLQCWETPSPSEDEDEFFSGSAWITSTAGGPEEQRSLWLWDWILHEEKQLIHLDVAQEEPK